MSEEALARLVHVTNAVGNIRTASIRARRQRDFAVYAAYNSGETLAKIGQTIGLSRGSVHRIVNTCRRWERDRAQATKLPETWPPSTPEQDKA